MLTGLLSGSKAREMDAAFKNPFSKNLVSWMKIEVYNRPVFFGPSRGEGIDCEARVYFKNGSTEGSQKFEGKNFQSLLGEIENFIKSLE